jgi:tetratricopeptide (TPR) repeat protein
MKKILQSLALGALVTTFTLPALALGHSVSPVAATTQDTQAQDPAKAELYKKFTDNRKTNQPVAYEAAKEYLGKYTEDDQYTQYLKKWVASYEKSARALKLNQLIYTDKNYGEAFSTGKQVIADDPANLKALIDLGYAGYSAAATTKADTYNAEAMNYARQAIQQIESGKAPDTWAPFKGKDDTLAYLYYTLGYLNLKSNPSEAVAPFIRSVEFESDIKKNASTYYFVAAAYDTGMYNKMSEDYRTRFANKPASPEQELALANLNQVIDRTIDAYARAIATAGTDPKNKDIKDLSMKRLTDLYKFRHDNSEAGLNEFVTGITAKPLPPVPTPITTLPTPAPSPTPGTGTGSGSGVGASTGTTPAQPGKPAATTPAQPGNRTTPASTTAKPAPPTANAKPVAPVAKAKPKTAHARRP